MPPTPPQNVDIDILNKTTTVLSEVAADRDLSDLIAAIQYLQEHDGDVTPTTLNELVEDPFPQREALRLTRHLRQHHYIGPDAIKTRTNALPQVATHVKLLEARSEPREPDLLATFPDDDALPSADFEPLLTELMELIKTAKDHLWIISPYLSEDAYERLEPALETAAGRGASISLLTRYLTYGGEDGEFNRDFVRRLLNNQDLHHHITLYEYIDSTTWATFHAKVVIADLKAAYLGTANVTGPGFLTNLELGIRFRGDSVSRLAKVFESLRDSPHLYEIEPVGEEFRRTD